MTALERAGATPVSKVVALLGAGLTGIAVARLLASSDRGIDFTDEGLYILSADAGSSEAAFNNAFGRYTGLLFDLVGGDLVRFRQAGIVLLVGVGAILGDRIATSAAHLGARPVGWPIRTASAAAVAAGANHYYTLHLLTPSYNWLNLLGLGIGLIGVLGMATLPEVASRWQRWSNPALFALGVQLAAMGKLTSGPALVVVAIVVLAVSRSEPGVRRFAVAIPTVGAAVVFATLHAVFVNPLTVTIEQVRRGTSAVLTLDPDYSAGAQFRSVGDAIELIVQEAPWRFGIVLGPLVVVALIARRRPLTPSSSAALGAMAVGGTGVLLIVQDLWLGGTIGYGRLAWVGIAFILVALALLAMRVSAGPHPPLRRALVVPAMVMACAAAYAIGSNNGFFAQLNGGHHLPPRRGGDGPDLHPANGERPGAADACPGRRYRGKHRRE